MSRRRRYEGIGRVCDVLSLERPVYGRPRARLLELLSPPSGATVIDLGCGTGLNIPYLSKAVAPGGRVIGIDASESMLARAGSRVEACKAMNVELIHGDDVGDLPHLLARARSRVRRVDVVVATYVLSVLDDDEPAWSAIRALAAQHTLRLGIAEIGEASSANLPLRTMFALFAATGGADRHRRPWERVERDATLETHEEFFGGHVHIAVGSYNG